MVYGAKWPDDEDSDRAIKYFRKYVKVRTLYLDSFPTTLLMPACLANPRCRRRGLPNVHRKTLR